MAKVIAARFRNNGTPQTGLTPTIDIYRLSDDALVVNDGAMVEVANGWYKYEFTDVDGFDPREDFVYDADGGSSISSPFERFQEGACCASEPEVIADGVWEADQSAYTDVFTMGGRANATFSNTEQILLDLVDIEALIDLVRKYHTNRTRIDTTAKTLTVFDDDGVTPLTVFTLRDRTGTPSTAEVCERDPQP
jgi:hypothetical protein